MMYLKNVISHFREFCENCSIDCLRYIANRRLHIIERFFWLACVILSAFCASFLINMYRKNFESKAVSIVFKNRPKEMEYLPTISVCNIRKIPNPMRQDDQPDELVDDYLQSHTCISNCTEHYSDREALLLLFIHPSTYHHDKMGTLCNKMEACSICGTCFTGEERLFLEDLTFNCTDLFHNCSTAGESFDCCHYFRPLITPFGKCYLLNSLQNNDRNSEHWFNKTFFPGEKKMEVTITGRKSIQVSVLSHEDIPNSILPSTVFINTYVGKRKWLQVFMEKIVNDPDVHEILPAYRKCRFSNEVLPTSLYKAHSFSACFNDCIRMHQLRLCNCTIQALVPKANEKYPPCDVKGLLCLENASLIKPYAKSLLPWSKSGKTCDCLPSCTEFSLESAFESTENNDNNEYNEVTVSMSIGNTFDFRRQAIQTYLDIIVTIGGVLGLFLGASLLTGLEILHSILLGISKLFLRP